MFEHVQFSPDNRKIEGLSVDLFGLQITDKLINESYSDGLPSCTPMSPAAGRFFLEVRQIQLQPASSMRWFQTGPIAINRERKRCWRTIGFRLTHCNDSSLVEPTGCRGRCLSFADESVAFIERAHHTCKRVHNCNSPSIRVPFDTIREAFRRSTINERVNFECRTVLPPPPAEGVYA